MKDVKITYNGKEEMITVNDHPNTGIVFKIAKMGMDWTKPIPEIKPQEFFVALACNLIQKAPWGATEPSTINNLDFEVSEQIGNILAEILPLERFLSMGAKLMYGKKLDQSPSTTESTLQ